MRRKIFAFGFLMASAIAGTSIASETVFTSPVTYCFPQIDIRGNSLRDIVLDYQLVVHSQDRFKEGMVFVGFRRPSKPDELWLPSGNANGWSQYIPNSSNVYYPAPYIGRQVLQAVIPVQVLTNPTDILPFAYDGELLVGYGLIRDGAATNREVFDEMVSNRRYFTVWKNGAIGNGFTQNSRICLTSTSMTYTPDEIGIH